MKIPSKATLDVRCEIAGPVKVRIIDATLNANKFESKLTCNIAGAISNEGVALEGIKSPRTPADFFTELAAPGDFNCLLLVAHGQVEPQGCRAGFRRWLYGRRVLKVRVAGLLCPWLLLGHANADLSDKMVLLAVCGGLCPDSIWTWVTDQHLALVLVASERSVVGREILSVFPPLLGEMNKLPVFTPEDVDLSVKRHNTNDAFRVYSGVGIHHTTSD